MGEAIARFRELALASRCRSDAAFIQPSWVFLPWLPPSKAIGIESRLIAGDMQPREFASLLRAAARRSDTSLKGEPDLTVSRRERQAITATLGGRREATLSTTPTRELDRQHAAALREASDCEDRLLASIERRLAVLSEATLAMREMAADAWLSRYSRTKVEYAKQLVRWQRAYDALGRFSELPPALSSTTSTAKTKPAKQKKQRDRKGVGGRKKKYPVQFVRDVQAARSREEKACRRAKERLPSKVEWLRLYCQNRGIDTTTMFPSENEASPEPWDVRAKRFWKAAAARVKRAGN